MFDQEEIPERKAAFAAAHLRYPLDPFKAALSIEPRAGHAAFMASNWCFDPEVQAEMRKLRMAPDGIKTTIPTKEEFAAAIWAEAEQCGQKDTKLKYFELFAKAMNYIEKPPQAGNNNTFNTLVDNRRVMLIPAPQSLDQWEQNAIAQQAKLVNAAAS